MSVFMFPVVKCEYCGVTYYANQGHNCEEKERAEHLKAEEEERTKLAESEISKLDGEIAAWLDTNEGKFSTFYAEVDRRRDS